MGEIKVSSSVNYHGLLKKTAGVLLAVFLVWLGFSAWLFTMSVYDNMYVVKSGVSYLNIMFLNGHLFAALGILIGIAALNPFFWHSVLKRRLKTAALILLLSVLLAFVFFSSVGQQIGVQILLLTNAGNLLQSYLRWLEKVYFEPLSFSGEELYSMMPVFDFIMLMKILYVFSVAIVFTSLIVTKFSRVVLRAKKAAEWPQADLMMFELAGAASSFLRFIASAVFIGYFLFWYPALTYDVTSPVFRISLTISVILIILQILLEAIPFKKAAMVRNILVVLAIVVVLLGYALPQAYYRTIGGWDANKVSYEFNPRIKPHIELVKLLNGLNDVSETAESTGSLSDLEKVRLTSARALKNQLRALEKRDTVDNWKRAFNDIFQRRPLVLGCLHSPRDGGGD